jgi:NADPH-dependent F420 reductase
LWCHNKKEDRVGEVQAIAILGGTGKEGSGLALRWARAKHTVYIGSRAVDKAEAVAAELNGIVGLDNVRGMSNRAAAEAADVIVLAVPYSVQQATALDVKDVLVGKVLIDVTVPLAPPKVSVVNLPPGGSAVLALQKTLGPDVRVVSAFQNVSAPHLRDLNHEVYCDVLICTDSEEAGELTVMLAQDAGMRGWRCGPLANSVVSEGLTSVLIAINQRYKIAGAGIQITGTPKLP